MDKKEILDELKKRQGDNSQNKYAQTIGVSAQYLSDVYSGKRAIGPKVLNYLGIERKTIYRWR